ncbi:ATP-binding protein [uncultured Piscinibacter sp.]|uniref:ATP-binding protein n=1 Tax=uncultured Piscinibacter sp. TaxID=1131835 RepID=UPI00260FCF6F|nr:ATP-binding protein [uncultured Piscinibacter sp.]
MSLRRRLLVYLLVSAPLVWLLAGFMSMRFAKDEVDELFDTELIRLARQVQVTLAVPLDGNAALMPDAAASDTSGEADLGDLAIAVWARDGRLLLSDREGVNLPYRADAAGFADLPIGDDAWRVYYLQSFDGEWLVAAGQKAYEREELAFDLTLGQLLPWLAMLPVLLAAMAWAVRHALAPVEQLSDELRARGADDLQPVPLAHSPAELKPLVEAMNGLFGRIESALARERRFTADAAHELRTPLAVLRAQWDVVCHAEPGAAREQAEAKLSLGLQRLDRLVTQMLALSRLEDGSTAMERQEVDWAAIVEQAMSDCLPTAERRHIELACDWAQPEGRAPLPLLGDAALLTVLLRNLLDNAVRYAPERSAVLLRFSESMLEVENDGKPLPEAQLARLGERFYRPDGQDEIGSGLGLSIVQRIASLHGMTMRLGHRADGRGMRVAVGFLG